MFKVVEPLKFHQVVLYEACREKWPSIDVKVAYNIAVVLIQAVLPATVLLVVHIRIAAYLHAHTASQKDSRRAQRELQRNKRTTLLLIGNFRNKSHLRERAHSKSRHYSNHRILKALQKNITKIN